MTKTLEARLADLEQKAEALKGVAPALVCIGSSETDEEARARFERERGRTFPACGLVIRLVVKDCRIRSDPDEVQH